MNKELLTALTQPMEEEARGLPTYRLPLSSYEAMALLRAAYLREVEERMPGTTLDEVTFTRIDKVAHWLVKDNKAHKPSLLLYGDKGTGKTTLLRAIKRMICRVREHYSESLKHRYRLSPEEVKEAEFWQYNIATPTLMPTIDVIDLEKAQLQLLKRCQLLLLDDLGVEPTIVKNYGTERAYIVDILNHRYEHRMATVISTNLDEVGIASIYGDRTEDRIKEICNKINYEGDSYRR